MCDLHVVALHYTATPSNTASFDDAPPIGAHIDGFAFRLYEGGLTLTPSSHLAPPPWTSSPIRTCWPG